VQDNGTLTGTVATLDRETNLAYNWMRDYDAGIGRYVQSDPIGLQGGSFSTYSYAGQNPLGRIDPTGEFVFVIALPAIGEGLLTLGGYLLGGAAIGTILSTSGDTEGKDPVRDQKPFNPGRDCDGKCNKCPPPIKWQAPGDAHGSTGGSHWHGIVWNQDPQTCMCYPTRVSGSDPDNLR